MTSYLDVELDVVLSNVIYCIGGGEGRLVIGKEEKGREEKGREDDLIYSQR